MEERTQIRQGDVLLVPIAEPKEKTRINALGLRVPGERTGHAHLLPAKVYEAPDTQSGRALLLEEPDLLTHDEHDPRVVVAGWWEPRMQREFVPSFRPSPRAMFD